jgi:hypothetical protein
LPTPLIPATPLGKLALRQGRLNPVIWLTVITLSFLPAGYFFKDHWLVYFLIGLPLVAFSVTLIIAWCWAIFKPDFLLSEDYEALMKQLANTAATKEGLIPAGVPIANPELSSPISHPVPSGTEPPGKENAGAAN